MSKAAEKYADEILALVSLKKPDELRQLNYGAINDLRTTMINSYRAGSKDYEAIKSQVEILESKESQYKSTVMATLEAKEALQAKLDRLEGDVQYLVGKN